MSKISILGAGTWGIALARMLCNIGHEVSVWSAISDEIDELLSTHRQKTCLKLLYQMVYSLQRIYVLLVIMRMYYL